MNLWAFFVLWRKNFENFVKITYYRGFCYLNFKKRFSMDKMREFMQSWLGKLVLVLVLAPMAFLGVQSFGPSGLSPDEAIKVDDTSIGLSVYNQAINDRKDQLKGVDPSLINEQVLADEVLESLIQRALLENQAKFLGLTISDAMLTQILAADPEFADANGNFSEERFAKYLQERRMSRDMLFEVLRTQFRLRQLADGMLNGAIFPNSQISRLIDLQVKNREVWLHRYDWKEFADKVSVSEAEVKSYYDTHKDRLKAPAMVDLSYIEFDPATVKLPGVSEEELKAQYQAYLQQNGQGTKQLAQILLSGENAKARADEVKAKLDAGESFEELAKTYSDDPTGKSGGSIGAFNADVFGEDASKVQAAITPLSVGQTTAVIQTSFGYQIFKVTEVADAPSLDSLKDELTAQVAKQKQQNTINELISKIDTMAVDAMGIADIAKEVGMSVKRIENYPQTGNKTELPMPAVIATAFDEHAIDEQAVSPNIQVADKVVWVQSSNYRPAKNLTLDEAREQVKTAVTKERAIKLAYEAALAKVQANKENPKALATASASIGVVGMQNQGLNQAERASLFLHDNKDGLSLWAVETDTGASILVGSPITSTAQSQLSPLERQQASMLMRNNVGQDQLMDYLRYLQDSKKVEINQQAINARTN